MVVVFSSLLLLLVDPVAEVLRKVFRSGLANWSADTDHIFAPYLNNHTENDVYFHFVFITET